MGLRQKKIIPGAPKPPTPEQASIAELAARLEALASRVREVESVLRRIGA
jgi:hypothetical protein